MSIWREAPEKKRSRSNYRDIKIEDLEFGDGLRRIRNLGARSETEIKEKLEEISHGRIPVPSVDDIGYADGLYQKIVKTEKVLNDYIDGGSIGEEPELDLKLNHTVDMGGINQKIAALIS